MSMATIVSHLSILDIDKVNVLRAMVVTCKPVAVLILRRTYGGSHCGCWSEKHSKKDEGRVVEKAREFHGFQTMILTALQWMSAG